MSGLGRRLRVAAIAAIALIGPLVLLAGLLRPAVTAGDPYVAPDVGSFTIRPTGWRVCEPNWLCDWPPSIHVGLSDTAIQIVIDRARMDPIVIQRDGTEWWALEEALSVLKREDAFAERNDIDLTTLPHARVRYQELVRVIEIAHGVGFTGVSIRPHGGLPASIQLRHAELAGVEPRTLRLASDATSLQVHVSGPTPKTIRIRRDGNEWSELRAVLRRLLQSRIWTSRTVLLMEYDALEGRPGDWKESFWAVRYVRGW